MTNSDINLLFAELSTDKYRKFSAKLIPNINNVLGIRLPHLRALAKDILAEPDWRTWLATAESTYMEHVMLQGLVIAYAKLSPEERMDLLREFIPKIDNWSVCDSVVTTLKFAQKHQTQVWDFVQPYLRSEHEYELRFALVMLLAYYVNEAYLPQVFNVCTHTTHTAYYVQMAVAWLVSVCCAKFPSETYAYLASHTLDTWVHNKSIQKCVESYRVTDKMKQALRALKRK